MIPEPTRKLSSEGSDDKTSANESAASLFAFYWGNMERARREAQELNETPRDVKILEGEQAQAAEVVHIPSLLCPEEMDEIHRIGKEYKSLKTREDEQHKYPQEQDHHEIYYMHREHPYFKPSLHTEGTFQTLAPSLFQKILDTVTKNDRYECLKDRSFGRDYNVRCIEYHIYTPGGSLSNPKHCDLGTVYTIGILLADPSDYEGGIFQTLEVDGSMKQYPAKAGDALIWPGHKFHSVTEITKGERRVFVMELWAGPRANNRDRMS